MNCVPRSILFASLLSASLTASAFAAQDYFQGWDVPDDPAGWIPNTISCDVDVVNCCGNPGGFINSFRINSTFDEIGITSELAEVSGDYAAGGIVGVSFDLFTFQSIIDVRFRVRFQDATFNGWSYQVAAVLPTGSWQSYAIAFDPTWTDAEAILAGWVSDGAGTPDFATTMSNVYHPEIRVAEIPTAGPVLNGISGVGVDNFHLIGSECTPDVTGPEVEIVLSRDVLWPPNHKQVEVCAEINVSDNCDPAPTVDLVSVTSNEPDNGLGDGDTEGDIEILEDNCFLLRAERAGGGDGRKYTITYTATDASGNVTTDSACVVVPHDQRGHAMAGAGFAADGHGFLPFTSSYEVIIPSTKMLDARSIEPDRVLVGNHLAVLTSRSYFLRDANRDGREDLTLVFDRARTEELLAATEAEESTVLLETVGAGTFSLTKRATVDVRYEAGGSGYLVPNVLKLRRHTNDQWDKEDGDGSGQAEIPREGLDIGGGTLTLAAGGRAVVEVFDIQGRRVRTLLNQEMAAGTHDVAWDGLDDAGRRVPRGMYFTRLTAPGIEQTRKVMISAR